MGLDAVATPLAQQRHAVFLGQHQVEDDGVITGRPRLEVGLLAVLGKVDGKPFLFQPPPEGA